MVSWQVVPIKKWKKYAGRYAQYFDTSNTHENILIRVDYCNIIIQLYKNVVALISYIFFLMLYVNERLNYFTINLTKTGYLNFGYNNLCPDPVFYVLIQEKYNIKHWKKTKQNNCIVLQTNVIGNMWLKLHFTIMIDWYSQSSCDLWQNKMSDKLHSCMLEIFICICLSTVKY